MAAIGSKQVYKGLVCGDRSDILRVLPKSFFSIYFMVGHWQ